MRMIRWALLLLGACSSAPAAQEPPPRVYPEPSALPVRAELPDPLTTFDGKKISTREEWEKERRPELKALFQHYMYGTLPPKTDVTASVRRTDGSAFGGKATLKEVVLTVAGPKKIDLLLVLPNNRSGAVPVFVGLNFTGNHTLVTDPAVALPSSWMRGGKGDEVVNNRATEKGRGKNVGNWALEQSFQHSGIRSLEFT